MELLKSFGHPDEIMALIKYKWRRKSGFQTDDVNMRLSKTLRMCYGFLNLTSRSFAAVIQSLDGQIKHAVCIFYLVLRALDTVEDDMSLDPEVKVPMLKNFYKYLQDADWRFEDSKEKDKIVLQEFPVISAEFRHLSPAYQEVITDITKQMGAGMVEYLDRAPASLQEWDQYCHYVAGLVGIGLSKLFAASGLEDESIGSETKLSNSMGLFLQKTNIIRDYLEDIDDNREFWPKEVWGKYAGELRELASSDKERDATACLNELVTNALQHLPDCLEYMSRLRNQTVFNFCAIPQVMAIATLERCYNNPDVFRGVVKIRKGEAVRMMMEATDLDTVKAIIKHFTAMIQSRIPVTDPVSEETQRITTLALKLSETKKHFTEPSISLPVYMSGALLLAAIGWNYWASLATFYENAVN